MSGAKNRKKSVVTMEDIAHRLNVSKMTVSKALRDHRDISEKTKKKVITLVQELGFTPNYFARSLVLKRSKTIGVIVPKIAHSFFSSVIEAMYEAAFENGYEIILAVSQENVQRERMHVETLLSMRVDGMIVSVTQETVDPSIFQRVEQQGVSMTFFDRVLNEKKFNRVIADDFGGAYSATEQAIKAGYKKITHMSGYQHTSIGKNRLAGYRAALKHYGIKVHEDWIVPCGFSDKDGYDQFLKMVESDAIPECIFCVTYPVALGVCRAASELGMNIPKDIDLISFGSSTLNNILSPSLSYIDQPTRELGRTALEITIQNIKGNNTALPQTITLPTRLVLQDTCLARVKRFKHPRIESIHRCVTSKKIGVSKNEIPEFRE